MGVWMIKYAQKELLLTFINWKGSSLVGLFGAITTACWFYAFSANAVAPVRALGQIEIIIALFISIFFYMYYFFYELNQPYFDKYIYQLVL